MNRKWSNEEKNIDNLIKLMNLYSVKYKENLKRMSTAAEPGNADVGHNVYYLTNFS